MRSLLLVGFGRRAIFYFVDFVSHSVLGGSSPSRQTGVGIFRDRRVGLLGSCIGELRCFVNSVGDGVFNGLHFEYWWGEVELMGELIMMGVLVISWAVRWRLAMAGWEKR